MSDAEQPRRVALPPELEVGQAAPSRRTWTNREREARGNLILGSDGVPTVSAVGDGSPDWGAQSSPEESGPPHKRLAPFLLTHGLILATIAVSVFVIKDVILSQREGELAQVTDLTSSQPIAIQEQIAQTAKAYFAAASIDDKITFVRRQAAVRPLMEEYYSRHPLEPESLKHLSVRMEYQEVTRAHDLYLAAVETESGGNHALLAERTSDGDYAIDWESHVAYNPMSFEAFTQAKPEQAQPYRVYASLGQYYNFEFNDRSKYLAVNLAFPHKQGSLYGYIAWDHPDLKRMVKALVGGKESPMILDLKFRKNPQDLQVEITGFHQHKWFVSES